MSNNTYSIAIRTVPRAAADYCTQTLVRLAETGSIAHPQVRGVHVSNRPDLTPNRNGCNALRMAARDQADWIIFLEDDVDFINDFIGSVDRWLVSHMDAAVLAYPLSCFYSGAMDAFRSAGVWEYPLEKYYGSQGIVMRTGDAVTFANWLERKPIGVSFDLHLSGWHREVHPDQKFLLTPSPCFLDHTGEFSSIGPPGSWERVGRVESFGGRDYSYELR